MRMNANFEKLGFYPAEILLPKKTDMTKWAVVACDQFTSQPEYWQAVEETVGDAPSHGEGSAPARFPRWRGSGRRNRV